jgi:hypothetical protein
VVSLHSTSTRNPAKREPFSSSESSLPQGWIGKFLQPPGRERCVVPFFTDDSEERVVNVAGGPLTERPGFVKTRMEENKS